jgi:hypothetical protein
LRSRGDALAPPYLLRAATARRNRAQPPGIRTSLLAMSVTGDLPVKGRLQAQVRSPCR